MKLLACQTGFWGKRKKYDSRFTLVISMMMQKDFNVYHDTEKYGKKCFM